MVSNRNFDSYIFKIIGFGPLFSTMLKFILSNQ